MQEGFDLRQRQVAELTGQVAEGRHTHADEGVARGVLSRPGLEEAGGRCRRLGRGEAAQLLPGFRRLHALASWFAIHAVCSDPIYRVWGAPRPDKSGHYKQGLNRESLRLRLARLIVSPSPDALV